MNYGTFQIVVGAVFAAIAVALMGLFAFIAARGGRDVPLEDVQRTGYRLRKRWLFLLSALLPLVVGIAALATPYPSGDDRTVVKVTSGQFFFAFDPPQVASGTKVRFDVTSVDVNHGFGLYDPDETFLGSVQAMPGRHNKLDLTLSAAGRYRVLCFEFCGLKHHEMAGSFTVTAG